MMKTFYDVKGATKGTPTPLDDYAFQRVANIEMVITLCI